MTFLDYLSMREEKLYVVNFVKIVKFPIYQILTGSIVVIFKIIQLKMYTTHYGVFLPLDQNNGDKL